MAKTKISEFNANPALNTDIDSINIAEGCAPSGINDAIRELMSQLKDWQAGTSNDPMVIGSSGSLTLNQGTANGVAYLNGSKVVTSGSALTYNGTNLTLTSGYFEITGANNLYLGSGMLSSSSGVLPLIFGLNATEQMRLTSTGLGIGTSSPVEKVQSSKGIAATGANQSVGSLNGFVADYSSGASRIFASRNGVASSTLELWTTDSGGAANKNATLDSSGNLGLGVTPSAWGTSKAIQISRFSLNVDSSGRYNNLATNAYNDGSWKYIASSVPVTMLGLDNANGSFGFLTAPSGTAGNAITFTQAMTLDASGNLLVGTTSTDPANNNAIVLNAPSSVIRFANTNTTGKQWTIGTSTPGIASAGDFLSVGRYSGSAWAEFTRIDSSGNFMVGTTAVSTSNLNGTAVRLYGGGSYLEVAHNNTATSGQDYAAFRYNGTQIGGITQSGTTAVAYNTSSDYRLKHDIAPMTGALAKVVALKPVTYKWNADGSDGEGFIAHELAEVCSHAVTGEKDAVDENGNPKYQGIDTSFLVATLTAALQELNAKFDAYVASHP